MAINNFLPTVWSETLLNQLDRQYIGVKNCTRDFEGDIKEKGSSVVINSISDISVFDYVKNVDMTAPSDLRGTDITLTIDQAKAFNFQIDDIDRAQAQPRLMKAAMAQAAAALADAADKHIYTLHIHAAAENKLQYSDLNADNIIDMIVDVRQKLLVNGVNSNIPVSLEVTPEVAAIILRSKILNSTDNSESLENGLLGRLVGFDIYVSHNVIKYDGKHKCFARTKRAIAFAEQLNEIEAYRPENRFADAVKGLHLFGAKVVRPSEFFVLDITL